MVFFINDTYNGILPRISKFVDDTELRGAVAGEKEVAMWLGIYLRRILEWSRDTQNVDVAYGEDCRRKGSNTLGGSLN